MNLIELDVKWTAPSKMCTALTSRTIVGSEYVGTKRRSEYQLIKE